MVWEVHDHHRRCGVDVGRELAEFLADRVRPGGRLDPSSGALASPGRLDPYEEADERKRQAGSDMIMMGV